MGDGKDAVLAARQHLPQHVLKTQPACLNSLETLPYCAARIPTSNRTICVLTCPRGFRVNLSCLRLSYGRLSVPELSLMASERSSQS